MLSCVLPLMFTLTVDGRLEELDVEVIFGGIESSDTGGESEQFALVWFLGFVRLLFYARNCRIMMFNYTVSGNIEPENITTLFNSNNDI